MFRLALTLSAITMANAVTVEASKENWCARENGKCQCKNGTVRYGANGKFKTKTVKGGSIKCNNATFGDPIVGTVKDCFCENYECAMENGTCDCPNGTVEYGDQKTNRLLTLWSDDKMKCNNATFGDPAVGTRKSCMCYPNTSKPKDPKPEFCD